MNSVKLAARNILEQAVAAKKFNMTSLFGSIISSLSGTQVLGQYDAITSILGKQVSDYVFQGILRFIFLIELVKTPTIDSTKFAVRWTNRFTQSDLRFANYDDCFQMFEKIVEALLIAVNDPVKRETLILFQKYKLLAYEIPLDYQERRKNSYIHTVDNIDWFWHDLVRRVLKLRSLLPKKVKNTNDSYSSLLAKAYDKVKVKTYLTDRVLTGIHKTNREKRWETHPASVHFALRRTCLEIEYVLINQLCNFEGFPIEIKQSLEAENILLSEAELSKRLEDEGIIFPEGDCFRCPITMEPLSFADFEREVQDPQHGKAAFQVGHLNPLKAVNDDPYSGHTAQNISWISSNGNRIQGSLSLKETRDLIGRIYKNYEQFGIR